MRGNEERNETEAKAGKKRERKREEMRKLGEKNKREGEMWINDEKSG